MVMQEYLAARYISNLDELNQVAVSREKYSTLPSFQRVWQFYFGVSDQDKPQGVITKHLKSNDNKHNYKLHLCHCAYEANSEVVAKIVAANLKGKFGPYEGNLSAYDCVAIAQTISHTTVPLKIMLKYSHCGDRGMEEIIGSLVQKLNVEKLQLPCADITADSFRHFSTALPAFSCVCTYLDCVTAVVQPTSPLLSNVYSSAQVCVQLSGLQQTDSSQHLECHLCQSVHPSQVLHQPPVVIDCSFLNVLITPCMYNCV